MTHQDVIDILEKLIKIKGAEEKAKLDKTMKDLLADVQQRNDSQIKDGSGGSAFLDDKFKFEWQSRQAQIKYLRSNWPTQQHRIMARMFYELFVHGFSSMDHQRACNILGTSPNRARAVMILMKRRGHLSRKRVKYGKQRYPYVYTLTEQGEYYGRYIWEHQLNYNLEMVDQLMEVAHMRSPVMRGSKEEYERDELTIEYSVVNYELKCEMEREG